MNTKNTNDLEETKKIFKTNNFPSYLSLETIISTILTVSEERYSGGLFYVQLLCIFYFASKYIIVLGYIFFLNDI